MVKRFHFRVNAQHFSSFERKKKNCFALVRLVLAFGLFSGFFWIKDKKNPSNSPQAKQPGRSKKFFLMTHMSVHFSVRYILYLYVFVLEYCTVFIALYRLKGGIFQMAKH